VPWGTWWRAVRAACGGKERAVTVRRSRIRIRRLLPLLLLVVFVVWIIIVVVLIAVQPNLGVADPRG
jgi:t-SNARE complex subunit (syntaxin)